MRPTPRSCVALIPRPQNRPFPSPIPKSPLHSRPSPNPSQAAAAHPHCPPIPKSLSKINPLLLSLHPFLCPKPIQGSVKDPLPRFELISVRFNSTSILTFSISLAISIFIFCTLINPSPTILIANATASNSGPKDPFFPLPLTPAPTSHPSSTLMRAEADRAGAPTCCLALFKSSRYKLRVLPSWDESIRPFLLLLSSLSSEGFFIEAAMPISMESILRK